MFCAVARVISPGNCTQTTWLSWSYLKNIQGGNLNWRLISAKEIRRPSGIMCFSVRILYLAQTCGSGTEFMCDRAGLPHNRVCRHTVFSSLRQGNQTAIVVLIGVVTWELHLGPLYTRLLISEYEPRSTASKFTAGLGLSWANHYRKVTSTATQ